MIHYASHMNFDIMRKKTWHDRFRRSWEDSRVHYGTVASLTDSCNSQRVVQNKLFALNSGLRAAFGTNPANKPRFLRGTSSSPLYPSCSCSWPKVNNPPCNIRQPKHTRPIWWQLLKKAHWKPRGRHIFFLKPSRKEVKSQNGSTHHK